MMRRLCVTLGLATLLALVACGGGGGGAAPLAADGCAALTSGRYVVLDPMQSDPSLAVGTVAIDAARQTLSVVQPVGTPGFTYIDDGGCSVRLNTPDTQIQIAVSPSGMAVALANILQGERQGRIEASVMLPEQAIGLAELAGEWNLLYHVVPDASGLRQPGRMHLTVDTVGHIVGGRTCDALGACEPIDPGSAGFFAVHSGGGFQLVSPGSVDVLRAIAFRPSGGPLSMVILVPGASGLMVASQRTAIAAPVPGQVERRWDTLLRPDGFAVPFADTETTFTGVDAASGTVQRLSASGLADTIVLNRPETGLRQRAAGACSIAGAATDCSELTVLPLPGTGVQVYIGVAQGTFGWVVDRP